MSAAVKPSPADLPTPLNPAATSFVSSRSDSDNSEAGSPVQRCGSPDSLALPEGIPMEQQRQDDLARTCNNGSEEAGGRLHLIPCPAPAPRGLSRQRSSSSSSLNRSGSASPPIPPLARPGMVPTYGWGAPYPVYHVYPPQPHADGPLERSASPPAVFPAGGSPPLPTGFISVPLMADPNSPTGRHMYGGSPPPFGASPPPYGSSPPHYGSSPPGVYMPPPPMMHHQHHQHQGHSGEYGMAHAGYHAMQHQHDFVHRMAGMSLGQPQPQRASSASSAGSSAGTAGGRSEGRASARIARSHRAGGAYNPAEFEFDLQEAEGGHQDARRTVMIRNIPNKYTQEMMLSVLHKSGFSGTFDFFYLPIDFRNKCNLGYCFVNFLAAGTAARLYRDFHNKKWEEYNSRKVCEVTYGRVQGRDTLVQHFRASKFPSDDIEFMPLVYTRVAGGAATNPVPIHDYLGSEGGSPTARDAEAARPLPEVAANGAQ